MYVQVTYNVIYNITYNIFFVLNKETYEKGLEKLVAAQDTSNIENNDISSDELRKRKKQGRRKNAKRHFSSSSDEENKENQQTQKKKQLPSLPQLQDFISNTPIINNNMENIENTSHEKTTNRMNSINSNCKQKLYKLITITILNNLY